MKMLKKKIGEVNFHSKILQTTYKHFTKKNGFLPKKLPNIYQITNNTKLTKTMIMIMIM